MIFGWRGNYLRGIIIQVKPCIKRFLTKIILVGKYILKDKFYFKTISLNEDQDRYYFYLKKIIRNS